VARVAQNFGIGCYQYADDSQLLVSFDQDDAKNKLSSLADCTNALREWFMSNGLALNPDKSNAILLGTTARKRQLNIETNVTIAGAKIELSSSLKILGVHFDSNLDFNIHVNKVCQAAYYHIKAIRRIRPMLTVKIANELASAVVTSRLDYCNAVLSGLSDYNVAKLQRVQNTLARIVAQVSRREHITPVMADLHWLPVSSRIDYKLAMLTFKTLSIGEPIYLAELIKPYIPPRNLRSIDAYRLAVPPVAVARTVFARRSFSYAAPNLWNSLSHELRSFDRTSMPATFGCKLKTELFKIAYSR
jgi:hypothetical protein